MSLMEVDYWFMPKKDSGFFLVQQLAIENILFMRFRNFPVGFKILTLPLDFHLNGKRLAGICRGWVFKVGRLYIFHLDERLTHTKSRPFAFQAGLQWTQKRILGHLMFQTCRPTNMELFGELCRMYLKFVCFHYIRRGKKSENLF